MFYSDGNPIDVESVNNKRKQEENKMTQSIQKTSKFLSYVLRHRPDEIGITLDAQGWVAIADLLKNANAHGKQLTESSVLEAVRTSDKQRFAISSDGLQIRANQGHSVKIDLALPQTMPPTILFHGTASRFIASIMVQGLIAGSRHHVHLSATQDTARTVGARHGMPVILEVKAKEMHEAGFPFFLSENGVWLTEAVPPQYLKRLSHE